MTPHDIRNWNEETRRRAEHAVDLFRQGYNCSQAVALAFCDLYAIHPAIMGRVSASFGGGIGRMRETCGAACGMFLLAGLEVTEPHDHCPLYPLDPTENPYPSAVLKKANYETVQRLAAAFKQECGSLKCGELLGLGATGDAKTDGQVHTSATPEARTESYYKRRPCVKIVELAARIFMDYLRHKYACEPARPNLSF